MHLFFWSRSLIDNNVIQCRAECNPCMSWSGVNNGLVTVLKSRLIYNLSQANVRNYIFSSLLMLHGLKITVQIWANEKKGNWNHNWKTALWHRWEMSCLILPCCYASSVFLFASQKFLKSTRGWGGTHCFLCEPEVAQNPQSERAQVSSAPTSTFHWGQDTWVMQWVNIRSPFAHLYLRNFFVFLKFDFFS